MALRLFNSLTRQKEAFHPLDERNVRMYVCGPTVYDYAHIGNARPAIVFDVLYRLLKHLYPGTGTATDGSSVTYVRNITDVDDKINARAREEYPGLPLNEAVAKVTGRTTRQYHADIAALGCLPPTVEPTCTSHIPEMVKMIEQLIANGCAYVAEGHVLFEVEKAKDYGSLSRRSLDEMMAGARVEVAPYKKNPMDFVLWKPSKPGEPSWPSPGGITTPGRPGWHIECSAMSDKWLWQEVKAHLSPDGLAHAHQFDIHGGGIDLQFPHHENELAQTRCAFGTGVMANVWMHNGFLQVEGQKMSKSLGNFVTIHELLETGAMGGPWNGDTIRLAMLRTNYRQPLDWTQQLLIECGNARQSFAQSIKDHLPDGEVDEEFLDALSDDLNTPAALSRLFELRDSANKGDDAAAGKLARALEFLGFFNRPDLSLTITYFVDTDEGLKPRSLVPNICDVNADYELSLIADHFDKEHADRAANTVELLRKFVPGSTVRDLRKVKGTWPKLLDLDARRREARRSRDWAESDALRDEMEKLGIVVRDGKDGSTSWEVKR